MRLSELFAPETVFLDLPPGSKDEILEHMLRTLEAKGKLKDYDLAHRDVLEREKVMSTGIGKGVAIPHAYTDGVDRLVAAFFRSPTGLDFASLDGGKVDLFFLILGPKESRRDHIKVLAKLSRLLNHQEFREALRQAGSEQEVMAAFKRFGDR